LCAGGRANSIAGADFMDKVSAWNFFFL
jgi:hypothetical protein